MQRYFALRKENDKFILEDGDIHHIKNVMRMKNNEKIEVVFDKTLYLCNIVLEPNLEVRIDKIMDNKINNSLKVVLIVPVLKEQKMDFILQKSTELGVSSIIPIITERTIVKINDNEKKKIDRWTRIVKEASEQCKRIDVPNIENVKKIEDLIFDDGVKYVCSTVENVKNIKNVMYLTTNYDKMYIVVGPEGGLTNMEEQKLNELGFMSISLGNRIMRVETVPLFVLSILNYEMME